jgi:long-chain acyl-CoA synthetase
MRCAGEYVAVEKVEAVYKRSRVVEQIWVYGNSFEASLVAVVVPKEDALQAWAAANGVQGDFRALVGDARAAEHVLSELSKVGKEDKLKVLRRSPELFLCPQPCSIPVPAPCRLHTLHMLKPPRGGSALAEMNA